MTCGDCTHSHPRPLTAENVRVDGYLGCTQINESKNAILRGMFLNPRHPCVFEVSAWEAK